MTAPLFCTRYPPIDLALETCILNCGYNTSHTSAENPYGSQDHFLAIFCFNKSFLRQR